MRIDVHQDLIEYPRGRALDAGELETAALELAGRGQIWRHLIRHERGRRFYEQLWRDEHVAAWLICWSEEQDTGFHDHDLSAGAVSVAHGAVREQRLALGAAPLTRVFAAGSSFAFDASDITVSSTGANGRRSPCTSTRLRSCGWARTASEPTARSRATRCPTPRSYGRWHPR